jgi:hypothetical protein
VLSRQDKTSLKQLVLKSHVRLRLETNAGTEDVGQGTTLLSEGVDNRGSVRHERGLEHVRQDAENRVEALVLATLGLPGDAGHELGDEDEIDDERGGEEGVLAHVEEGDGLVAAHEDLGVVLVEGALVVTNSGHVLDDDGVVGVLTLLVQDVVGLDHVVDDVGLGDLLGAELALGAQVLAVVVTEMVVRSDRGELDTGADQEVDEGGLHLGLAGFEVVTADERAVPLSKGNGTGNEGVLGGAVDEWHVVEDTGNGEDGGRSNLLVSVSDGLQQVVGSVVDARDELSKALSVGSPHDNDLVEVVGGLEVGNVLADLLDVLVAGLGAGEEVVGTVLLVGGNEIRVVDGWERGDGSHLLADHGLEGGLKDSSTVHGISQVHRADIPSANDEVVGVDHGENVMEGDVDILGGLRIRAQLHGGGHGDGTVVVSSTVALTCGPGEVATVGNDTSGDGGTIVTTETDQHHTGLGDGTLDLEVVDGLLGGSNVLASLILRDRGGAVGVLGLDSLVGVLDVWAVDREKVLDGGSTVPACNTSAIVSVWCHILVY